MAASAEFVELQGQLLDGFAQKLNFARGAVLIDSDLVLDVTGPIGVFQSIERLHQVAVGRRNAGNHHSARVATQGVLQDASKLVAAIGHMRAFLFRVPQSADDVAYRIWTVCKRNMKPMAGEAER